jgi:hypothetical protein
MVSTFVPTVVRVVLVFPNCKDKCYLTRIQSSKDHPFPLVWLSMIIIIIIIIINHTINMSLRIQNLTS